MSIHSYRSVRCLQVAVVRPAMPTGRSFHLSFFRPAFTLAEVLFAMAILSFALLTIIGLMPSTLASLNDAEARIAEARIVQSINTEFQLKPWDQLPREGSNAIRYYDQRGIRTSAPLEGGAELPTNSATYAVAIYAQAEATTPTVPGDKKQDGSKTTEFLRTLHIVITRQIKNTQALQDHAIRGTNRVYAVSVAKLQPVIAP